MYDRHASYEGALVSTTPDRRTDDDEAEARLDDDGGPVVPRMRAADPVDPHHADAGAAGVRITGRSA